MWTSRASPSRPYSHRLMVPYPTGWCLSRWDHIGWWGRPYNLEVKHVAKVGRDNVCGNGIAVYGPIAVVNGDGDADYRAIRIDYRPTVLLPGVDGIGQAQMRYLQCSDRQGDGPGVNPALTDNKTAVCPIAKCIDGSTKPSRRVGQREVEETGWGLNFPA